MLELGGNPFTLSHKSFSQQCSAHEIRIQKLSHKKTRLVYDVPFNQVNTLERSQRRAAGLLRPVFAPKLRSRKTRPLATARIAFLKIPPRWMALAVYIPPRTGILRHSVRLSRNQSLGPAEVTRISLTQLQPINHAQLDPYIYTKHNL